MRTIQARVSNYEQKKVLEEVIDKLAKALNVAPEFIRELEEDPVTVIIENNTFEKGNNNVGYITDNTITNNPLEQILGKKLFAFSRLHMDARELIRKIDSQISL